MIVGRPSSKPTGQHITICERFDEEERVVHTFEGNARGRLPDDRIATGVISQQRPLPKAGLSDQIYRVMHVIRPLPEDFMAKWDEE